MRNSIKYLIIFILFFSCSFEKKDELSVDIDIIKKEGNQILEPTTPNNIIKKTDNIKKFSNYTLFNLEDWKSDNYQASNFLPHTIYDGNLEIEQKKKFFRIVKDNYYQKKIISLDKKLFYIDDESNLHSLDLNFNLLYKFTIHQKKNFQDYKLSFSLTSDGNNLFISDNLGYVHSYSIRNNKINWSNYLGVPYVSNILYYQNNLYVTNENGKIYSFNSIDGRQNWSFETASNLIKDFEAFQIAIENNFLVFSNDLGDIYCIDLSDKKLLWNINLIEKNSQIAEDFKISKLVIKDSKMYMSNNQKNLISINLKNGTVEWILNLNSSSTIPSLITPEKIINLTEDGYLSVVNKYNGLLLFRDSILNNFKKKEKIYFISIFLSSNNLYALSKQGFIFKINTKNLNNISYKKLSNGVSSFPIIIFNKIFFLDKRGFIYKLK